MGVAATGYNFSTPQAVVAANNQSIVILSSVSAGFATGQIQTPQEISGANFSSFPDLFVSSVTATGSAVTFHFTNSDNQVPTGYLMTSGFTGAASVYNFPHFQAITSSTTSSATIASTASAGTATGEVQLPMAPFLNDYLYVQLVAYNSSAQTNFFGQSIYADSTPVGPITAASAPVNLTAPVISGTPQVGYVLTLAQGTWTGTPTITDQWEANGVAISGQTGPTYIPVVGDETKNITVVETATNPLGSVNATSNSLSAS